MNNRFTLAQAFIEAEIKDYESADPTQVWTTSTRFNSSMKALINKEKKFIWKCINTTGKKVAVLILSLLLLSGCAMSVEAIRTPVVHFVSEIYETFTRLFVDEDTQNHHPNTIEQTLSPTYMLNGYKQTEEQCDLLLYQLRWENVKKEEIVYQQSLLTNYNAIIDTENSPSQQIITVHGESIYFQSNNKHTLIWNNGSYSFKLTAPLSITVDELIALANGVK